MITELLISVCIVVFALSLSLCVVDSMHFFQLNSYRFDTHTKWMKENTKKYLTHCIFAVLMLICLFFEISINIKAGVLIALFALSCLAEKPKKAKKPLVYTPRVKRMLFTTIILCAVILLVTAHFTIKAHHESITLLAAALLYAFGPALVLVANLINKPMELSINQGYTNDAKKILKACPDLKIIGITGSYGKTSVKYYLTTLLKSKYNVLMTPESYNTPMGVVKTIRGSLKATHEIFVCEMGAKWVGDIKELCDIVHPQHGVITSIGPQHLESFKTLDAVKNTKFELADSLPQGGMLFLNGDDENISVHGSNRPYISYAIENDADYKAFDITVSQRGTSFSVRTPEGETEQFTTKLIGRHNVLNIVGAIAISHKMGIALKDLKGAVRKLEGVPHRLELKESGALTIIDDAYNSNPEGAKMALDTLAMSEGCRVLITPGLVELGQREEEENTALGAYAASRCDYAVIVGGHNRASIAAGLEQGGFDKAKIFPVKTVEEAFSVLQSLSESNKFALLLNDLPHNYL